MFVTGRYVQLSPDSQFSLAFNSESLVQIQAPEMFAGFLARNGSKGEMSQSNSSLAAVIVQQYGVFSVAPGDFIIASRAAFDYLAYKETKTMLWHGYDLHSVLFSPGKKQ
jgi:hypothetical protein